MKQEPLGIKLVLLVTSIGLIRCRAAPEALETVATIGVQVM